MKYLAPCALLLCISAANAETDNTTSANARLNNAANVQQTTQAVARRLINILKLTTVSSSEQASISLKKTVIKALGEGKQMNEIRLATNQAVKELTGKALPAAAGKLTPSTPSSGSTSNAVQSTEGQTQSAEIVANPAEVSLDPETGEMVATVQPGESIFRLAQRVYGKENGRKYLAIYAANRDKIKNINVVVEGQVLTMP